ncbi:DUF4013 domain-containing protein [Methanobrevibacter sp. OttesenSCG-928-K11]|nr:DUF4013 domain-containing protein [Methanobrevibacter sp. OttesenSCG-928-K11]MDL2270598.1 DUF4013 domain-containing protein [Methanobrevibacter sp. OttesenSCG-928-I08]
MILDIYKDSLEYSFKDELAVLKLGIISFFSFLIIPIFLFFGYNYRVIKTATLGMINGDDEVPKFDDLASMFVDGLKVFLVKLIYCIPIFILLFGTVALGSGLENYNENLSTAIIIIGMLLTIIVGVFSYLFSLIAIPRMANYNDSFKEAFNLKEIFDSLKFIGILRYIVFYAGLVIIIFVIIAVVIGIILGVFGIIGLGGMTLSVYSEGLMGLFSSIGGTIIAVGIMIFNLLLVLIINPFLSIFENRAIGLIYEGNSDLE